MTQEEKAKRYDEVLEQLKGLIEGTREDKCAIMEEDIIGIFPELQESEDEKIRKALLELVHDTTGDELWVDYNFHKEDAIAWLEKQGEQEPTDKVEPFGKYEGLTDFERTLADICIGWIGEEPGWKEYIKDNADVLLKIAIEKFNSVQDASFKQKPTDEVEPKFQNGQWIVWQNKCYKVNYNGCGYELIDQNGLSTSLEYGTVDKSASAFTIQDAKDGDVLAFKKNISGIIICKSPTNYDTRSYCRLVCDNLINKEESGWDSTLLVPATKEQRDTLFAKMKEAGYEWDAENKQLNKISQRMISAEAKEAMYSNPAWSEEDEYRTEKLLGWINTLINYIHEDAMVSLDLRMERIQQVEQIKTWLKSLRPQNAWKPSDEQMIALRQVISGCSYDIEPLLELETKLKEF